MARVEMVAGNRPWMNDSLTKAREYADKVEDPEDKELLVVNIGTIE